MRRCLALAVLLVSACASNPAFEKAEGEGTGYSIKPISGSDNLKIKLHLPLSTDSEFKEKYSFRAAGEACASSGFLYFDNTTTGEDEFEVFCFKSSDRPSLAMKFRKDGLLQKPARFVIEDLNSKSSTNTAVGDELVSIVGKNTVSMAQIKRIVFEAAKSQKTSLPLEIKRDGRVLKVEEPIAILKDGAHGPEFLRLLRRVVP